MLGEQIFGELFQVVDATQLSFEGLLESFVFAEESFNSWQGFLEKMGSKLKSNNCKEFISGD